MTSPPARLENNDSGILERQRLVSELRAAGLEVPDIAERMGCSRHVVATLLSRLDDPRLSVENAGWVQGLPHRTARVLIQRGYTDKAQVATAFANGELSANLPNVGQKMMASLSLWLGMPAPQRQEAMKLPTDAAIARARKLLGRAGYTVVPPGEGLS